jgi:hypothetical protein
VQVTSVNSFAELGPEHGDMCFSAANSFYFPISEKGQKMDALILIFSLHHPTPSVRKKSHCYPESCFALKKNQCDRTLVKMPPKMEPWKIRSFPK